MKREFCDKLLEIARNTGDYEPDDLLTVFTSKKWWQTFQKCADVIDPSEATELMTILTRTDYKRSHRKFYQYLHTLGADPEYVLNTVLQTVIEDRDIEYAKIVQVLLDMKPDISSDIIGSTQNILQKINYYWGYGVANAFVQYLVEVLLVIVKHIAKVKATSDGINELINDIVDQSKYLATINKDLKSQPKKVVELMVKIGNIAKNIRM
jgi:hypothetical protein